MSENQASSTSLATGVHNTEEKSLRKLVVARSMKMKSSFLPRPEKKKNKGRKAVTKQLQQIRKKKAVRGEAVNSTSHNRLFAPQTRLN